MLSIDYGFNTSVRRSGHAACWCAALGGVVQFGGWPPSEQLGEVVRHEGSSCPLYLLPLTTIARHVHRADQRCGVAAFSRALAPHRQRRLRQLCDMAAGEPVCAPRNSHACDPATPSAHSGIDRDGTTKHVNVTSSRFSVCSSRSSSRARSAVSPTTEEASERGFEYDEGYVSERESQEGADGGGGAESSSDSGDSPSFSTPSVASPATAALQRPHGDAVAPAITVELLRQAALETGESMPYGDTEALAEVASLDHTSVSPSTRTGYAASALRDLATSRGGGAGHGMDREAPPVRADTREVRGKHTVRALRWQAIRPPVAPRSRHGHHLVSCGQRLYVIGGSYWAHGHALASTDMMYDVRRQVWHQISSLFPQRFCAALATSNAVPTTPRSVPPSDATTTTVTGGTPPHADDNTAAPSLAGEQQVLYYFGGLDYSHALTHSLHRLWLPQEVLEELPQYGAAPRAQFKGLLVCDVQRECTPEERRRGERALGRLFYMDGLQDGRPMAPCLRTYNLATGVWVRVGAAPDLVRSQVSMLQYEPADEHGAEATRLKRFEVMGGMPARRGRQRRSRMCHCFDAQQLHFDYSHALPVPGLTAHCVVLLPQPSRSGLSMGELAPANASAAAEGESTAKACAAALRTVHERCGAWSLCCGGNEDWEDAAQNSLGVPVGWLYLLSPRSIPLREVARVQMERLRIPAKVLLLEKDDLLDELF